MREIKFEYMVEDTERGWCKEIFPLFDIERGYADRWLKSNNFKITIQGPLVIRRQFTGLLDKNGKEIYEGDVINLSGDEFYTNESFSCDEMDFTGKVSMNSLLWMVDSDNCWVPLCDCLHEEFEVEIIGNIHESPELLK